LDLSFIWILRFLFETLKSSLLLLAAALSAPRSMYNAAALAEQE
jgi:hypothetical protein